MFSAVGQMDTGGVRVLLLLLHSGPVLPPLLHPHPLGGPAGSGRSPSVVGRVHLPHPGGPKVYLRGVVVVRGRGGEGRGGGGGGAGRGGGYCQ